MRILFDHNVPRQLRGLLVGHDVSLAVRQGWASLSNGDLMDQAEEAGFEVLITADKNLQHQQNLGQRRLALVVLGSNRWPLIERRVDDIRSTLDGIRAGEVREVPIPTRGEV